MNDFELLQRFELLARVATALLSFGSLSIVAWALADRLLPREARVGLRLLLILLLQLLLCAVIVQTLGVFGLLTRPHYLAASLLPGLFVLVAERRKQPLAAFLNLVGRGLRLWVLAPRFAAGWLAFVGLLYLAQNQLSLPENMDALSLHGPLVVEWIQSGNVPLESHWNYPQVWEYQFAALFLLTGSDLLAIVPGLLALSALLLAVRELAQRFRLMGYAGYTLSLGVIALPLLWRDTMKGDPVFALGILAAILALERSARGRRGAFGLLQAGLFLVIGAKASGFLYAFVLLGVWLTIQVLAGPLDFRRLARGLAGTALIQVSALSTQLKSLLVHGNPIYPVSLELAGRELLPGPLSLAGTSLLDHAGEWDTWRQFVLGGFKTVGLEWPLLLFVLPFGIFWASRELGLARFQWRRLDPGRIFLIATFFAILLLLILYWATPWTCSLKQGSCGVMASGASLRFAIAPLCLLYLVVAVCLRQHLSRRALRRLLALLVPLLVVYKWRAQVPVLGGETIAKVWPESVLGAVFVLAVVALWVRRPRFVPTLIPVAALILLAWAHALRVELTRISWWATSHQDVWFRAHREIPLGSEIGNNDRAGRLTYLFVGPRLENRIVKVPLDRQTIDPRQIPAGMDYFFYYANNRQELDLALEVFSRDGWQLWSQPLNGFGAFFSRVEAPGASR